MADTSGSCTAQCVIYIRCHPAAKELAPVLFDVLPEVTPRLPPDVAGGSKRYMCQIIAVDRKLFPDALFERPDIIEHIQPVLEGQVLVLVSDLLIIDKALLFLLLDAEILAPFIERTVRELPGAPKLKRADAECDDLMRAYGQHIPLAGAVLIEEPVLQILQVIRGIVDVYDDLVIISGRLDRSAHSCIEILDQLRGISSYTVISGEPESPLIYPSVRRAVVPDDLRCLGIQEDGLGQISLFRGSCLDRLHQRSGAKRPEAFYSKR